MGLPEMIARGLMERGESLGINKTVMNAVSELKVTSISILLTPHPDFSLQRNLPDLAASLARLPTSPSAASYATYPLVDERSSAERPPWEPRTRFEIEHEASELRSLQRRLGDSVGWIVDTLLLDEEDPDRAAIVRERKREALECLSYVRDVLKGSVPQSEVEESRLVGEEELKKRRKATEDKKAAEAANKLGGASTPFTPRIAAGPTPPQPTASSLPQFQAHPQASVRRLQDNLPPVPSFPRSTLGAPASSSPLHAARQKAPSPTPTISVLTPNASAVPLAPWNYTRSSFATRESPIATLPRMPSRPSAVSSVRHGSNARLTPTFSSQTPPEEVTKSAQAPPQDPLGVLR